MTDREKLIALLKSNMDVLQAAGISATATLRLADHLIANGVTFATDIKVGHWIRHYANRGGKKRTLTWAECSECHVCGSPQWKVCPVCETKMVAEVK